MNQTGEGGEAAIPYREIIAHFPTERQAREAAEAVGRAESARIGRISAEQAREEMNGAESGISQVEIGWPAWIGLSVGLIIGGLLGRAIFAGWIALPGMGPMLSAGPAATVFVGAGLLGSLGWLIGALLHLFSGTRAEEEHELRLSVPMEVEPEVERILAGSGASEVLASEPHG